jgi:hypothetical protein
MEPRTRQTLKELITANRRLLDRMEWLGMKDGRPLDQHILDVLRDVEEPMSTYALRRLIRRRQADIRGVLNLLLETQRVKRDPEKGKWSINE